MHSEGYGTWFVSLSVCLFVCYHVFCHCVQQGNEIVIRAGLLLKQLGFEKGDYRKTAFKSYGVKTKQAS